jgi:hypothetical protein
MPTSNTKPIPNVATDSPLGAPGGNEPYKTVRMTNMANPDAKQGIGDASPYETDRAGNTASKGDTTAPQAKPTQGA